MRTNTWLANKMYEIWEEHFADVPRQNFVLIKFGKGSRRQLGSIKWANVHTRIKALMQKQDLREHYSSQDDKRITVITVTSKFKNEIVPEEIVEATIAHELCHYAHGFSSPLNQLFTHPHKGGVVTKELKKRGLGELNKSAKKWIKENWVKILAS